MLPNLRSVYRFGMRKISTKFVNYKVGGPEGLFLAERELEVDLLPLRSCPENNS